MIERLELDNDFPGYFGLREGGILAVRVGLGSSSISGEGAEAEMKRISHLNVFKRTDDYYIARRTSQEEVLESHETPVTPIWFDAIDEGEIVAFGLRAYARRSRLPSELDPDVVMKLQIGVSMIGKNVAGQVVDQILSAMQAEELAAQIQAFKKSLI